MTLNLEPGRPADGLVVWRKGSATAVVEVKGKAAHAGVAPELGRNAAMEAAHQILQLGKLGDEDKKTTINFTVLKAGDRTNVIPDQAHRQGRRACGLAGRVRPDRERPWRGFSQQIDPGNRSENQPAARPATDATDGRVGISW